MPNVEEMVKQQTTATTTDRTASASASASRSQRVGTQNTTDRTTSVSTRRGTQDDDVQAQQHVYVHVRTSSKESSEANAKRAHADEVFPVEADQDLLPQPLAAGNKNRLTMPHPRAGQTVKSSDFESTPEIDVEDRRHSSDLSIGERE